MKKIYIAMVATVLGIMALFFVKSSKPAAQTLGLNDVANTQGSTTTQTSTSTNGSSAAITYKDGTYQGSSEYNRYGTVQVQVVISGGKLTDIIFNELPSEHPRSQSISSYAGPKLKQEAISAQSANVDIISGATSTSMSFAQSLQTALTNAKSTSASIVNAS